MSLAYFIRRLLSVIVVLMIVSVAVFAITAVLPGNAALMILGENASKDSLAALERQLGLDQPVYVQYLKWIWGAVQGDFGTSLRLQQPVSKVVGEAFANSASLAVVTLIGVTAIAIPMGAIAALWRGSIVDLLVGIFSYIGTALPEFVTATVLLVLFASPSMQLFPAGGFVSPVKDFWQFLHYVTLPAVTLGLILMAHISRQVRSEMSEVLSSDYVRAARIKGLSEGRVLWRHALPNSLAPAISVISLDIGYLLGGIIVVEEIFAWPGLGRLLIYALQNRDLPVIQAVTLLLAVVYSLSNLVADLIIAVLDPRVRYA